MAKDVKEINQDCFLISLTISLLLIYSNAVCGKIKKSTILKKLNEVIKGKKAMSADFAVLLGKCP